MKRNNLIKKPLTVAVILLFMSIALAPSINANISKESDLVEFTTEVCGLNGGKYTVSLSKEDAEEVENLIDDIERRLDEVETREETVEIFNEAIVELDKYDLLGGLSVKQVQRMVTGRFQNSRFVKLIEKIYSRNQGTLGVDENINCLVAGNTNKTGIMPGLFPMWMKLFQNFERLLWFIIAFAQIRPFYLFPVPGKPFPGALIGIIEGTGWVFTIGMNGTKSWNGTLIGGYDEANNWAVLGFTGIKILLDYNGLAELLADHRHFYLGFARWVIIEELE